MREQDALELIDAHLDDDHLTDQQVAELAAWLRENPQHAEQAFNRIFLHTFLRRRLQARPLPKLTGSAELVHRSGADLDATTPSLPVPQSAAHVSSQLRSRGRWQLLLNGGVLVGAVAFAVWWMWPAAVPIPASATAYDGFDYPATTVPAPPTDALTWPTTGGLQGLDGGFGWAEPWQESGPKVSVVVDHAREMNWDPKDMRKFRPLGHSDAQGRVLQSSGLQMRTAMGSRSLTSRKLDLASFPAATQDAAGLGRDGAVLWISFLAQSFNSAGDNNRFTYFQVGSREVSGFRLGKVGAAPSGNWAAMGLMTGAQVNLRSSAVPSGEVTFLVTSLEFRPGPEEAAVWVNPSLADEPKLAEATLRLSVPDFRFDSITINANYSTDIDEIRIGESFRAVAPVQ